MRLSEGFIKKGVSSAYHTHSTIKKKNIFIQTARQQLPDCGAHTHAWQNNMWWTGKCTQQRMYVPSHRCTKYFWREIDAKCEQLKLEHTQRLPLAVWIFHYSSRIKRVVVRRCVCVCCALTSYIGRGRRKCL